MDILSLQNNTFVVNGTQTSEPAKPIRTAEGRSCCTRKPCRHSAQPITARSPTPRARVPLPCPCGFKSSQHVGSGKKKPRRRSAKSRTWAQQRFYFVHPHTQQLQGKENEKRGGGGERTLSPNSASSDGIRQRRAAGGSGRCRALASSPPFKAAKSFRRVMQRSDVARLSAILFQKAAAVREPARGQGDTGTVLLSCSC